MCHIAAGHGLDHWELWGVAEVLCPDASGVGALVGGHRVQDAGSDTVHTARCSCEWFAVYGPAGGRCEHLFALELTMEACEQARARS